jgi:hypothetical protein
VTGKNVLTLFVAPLAFAVPLAFAASSGSTAIGVIRASGHFTVEGSEVWGNSTLFDGTSIETTDASSDLALRSGVRVQLSKGSRARVWQNRLLLEKGTGQVTSAAPFEVQAGNLKISGSNVRVGVSDRVEVAALESGARVLNGSGLLVASITPRRSVSLPLAPQTPGQIMRSGCLLSKENVFILQDDNTQEVAQLAGGNLAASIGGRVDITGVVSTARPTVSPATVLINVTSVTQRAQGGCLTAAQALGASTSPPQVGPAAVPAKPAPTPPPAASSGGLSKNAKIAIIVGAAGGGGAAAAVALGGKKSTSP